MSSAGDIGRYCIQNIRQNKTFLTPQKCEKAQENSYFALERLELFFQNKESDIFTKKASFSYSDDSWSNE